MKAIKKNIKVYKKPILQKEKNMKFPIEIINISSSKKIACRQCSSCHGCR